MARRPAPSRKGGMERWALLATVLGLPVAVVGIWIALHPSSAPPYDALARCRGQHAGASGGPLSPPAASGSTGVSSQTFAGCATPPQAGADAAGYWTVQLRDYELPGTAAYQKFTNAQVFETGCPALRLDYQFNSMGTVARQVFSVETNQTIASSDGRTANLYEVEGATIPAEVEQALGKHLLVLNNLRYTLQNVQCLPVAAGAPGP